MMAFAHPYDAPERPVDPYCDSPRFIALRAVDPDCGACNIASELGETCGCGTDDWYCTADCKRLSEHVERDHRICLHRSIREVLA